MEIAFPCLRCIIVIVGQPIHTSTVVRSGQGPSYNYSCTALLKFWSARKFPTGYVKHPVMSELQHIIEQSGGDRHFGTPDKAREERVRDYEKSTKIIAGKPWNIGPFSLHAEFSMENYDETYVEYHKCQTRHR